MKVLHISTSDVTGGAARSAYRLHGGLLGANVESQMLVQRRAGHDESVPRAVIEFFEGPLAPPSGLGQGSFATVSCTPKAYLEHRVVGKQRAQAYKTGGPGYGDLALDLQRILVNKRLQTNRGPNHLDAP